MQIVEEKEKRCVKIRIANSNLLSFYQRLQSVQCEVFAGMHHKLKVRREFHCFTGFKPCNVCMTLKWKSNQLTMRASLDSRLFLWKFAKSQLNESALELQSMCGTVWLTLPVSDLMTLNPRLQHCYSEKRRLISILTSRRCCLFDQNREIAIRKPNHTSSLVEAISSCYDLHKVAANVRRF